jgi:hypothetical protein
MTPQRSLLVRGDYLPFDQIQQITLSTDSLPLTATVLMQDGTRYDFVGEEAEAVRAQSEGLDIVTTTPVQHEILNTLPEEFRRENDETSQ